MKNLIILFAFLTTSVSLAQGKYLTKSGTLTFEASVPSFEEVKGTNQAVTAILNAANGEFAALALVKGFVFKNALMQEHFNENYAESDDFPRATFKGKITNYDQLENHEISGELTFHGVTKRIENISVNLNKEGDLIIIQGEFQVNVSDFNIKIPKIVKNKLNEQVIISYQFSLKKK